MKVFLWILSCIGLLCWCACFTFGYSYSEGGALNMSIILGVALLVAMGLAFWLMVRWSHPKSEDHKANAKNKEIAYSAVYLILSALSISGVAKFVTVQSTVKDKVRTIALQRMDELETIFGDENTPGSYLAYVEEKAATLAISVAARYTGTDESGKNDNVRVAVATFKDRMTKDGQFENLQNTVNNFLDHCRYSFNHWIPWTVTRYLNELDEKLPSWEEEVMQMSTASPWTENEPYKVDTVSKGNKLINMVKNPEGGIFTGLAILLIIVLQVIILLSYLTGRDWNKGGPVRGDKGLNVRTWG